MNQHDEAGILFRAHFQELDASRYPSRDNCRPDILVDDQVVIEVVQIDIDSEGLESTKGLSVYRPDMTS